MILLIATFCLASSAHCSGGLPKSTVRTQIISSEGCAPAWDGRANGTIDIESCRTPYTIVWRDDGEEITRRQVDPRNATISGKTVTVSAGI